MSDEQADRLRQIVEARVVYEVAGMDVVDVRRNVPYKKAGGSSTRRVRCSTTAPGCRRSCWRGRAATTPPPTRASRTSSRRLSSTASRWISQTIPRESTASTP
jgi:hypothetical protein